MQYSDYKEMVASEKITLATLDASKRLMGWVLHSGSVYKITGIDFSVIASIEDSGNAYTEAESADTVTASKYYFDRGAQTLYIRTTGSDNPNGRFIVATFRLFFANVPIVLPHDLNTGYEVQWEPMIKTNSSFGVEIDTINQTSEAIEGSGSLTLYNDSEFWPANFDKLYFENCACLVYSYHRDLEPQDAKLIYRGFVDKKSYSPSVISFGLKDLISQLKAPVALGTIGDLGLRTSSDLEQARQRLVLGRVFGLRPVNTDQVLEGYPIAGTVSISYNNASLSGSGTQFLKQLKPDDRLVLDGVEYTVATVTSNTAATLTENYADTDGLSGASALVIPELPKRWNNRTWKVAGHALREPLTAVANGSSISTLFVDDNEDIYPGDWIYVGELGSGDLVQVDSTSGDYIVKLRTSLLTIPTIGTPVLRPAVQNVRIDDTQLVYYTDYTFDAETATLTLRDTAESNSSPIRNLTSNLSFSSGSRTVTGTGLKTSIKPGYMVGVAGNADFFEVLSVDSDTSLTLTSNATFTSNSSGRYKPLILDPDENVLTLDVLGKTADGETNGSLLKTAPRIVEALLKDAGLESYIDAAAFTEADQFAPMHLGLAFPPTFAERDAPTYRTVINAVSKSVFGSLVQTDDLKIAYNILRPSKPVGTLRFDESDILSWKFESSASNVVKTSIVEYLPKEYDYLTGKESIRTQQKTSDTATHLARSTRQKVFVTHLVDETDAEILANRWAFLLEHSAGRGEITTKLQGMNLEVGDVIEVSHRKFFQRYGLSLTSRLFLVESVKKNGNEVSLTIVDLSSAFSRVAVWNENTNEYANATDREKLYGGYWTDQYGLIDNDPNSFGTNLIW